MAYRFWHTIKTWETENQMLFDVICSKYLDHSMAITLGMEVSFGLSSQIT